MIPLSLSEPPEGLIGGYQGHSLAVKILMIVFTSIALYNATELFILIFLTFNRYNGLYFWTMFLSNVFGVIPHAIGYLLEFFDIGPIWLAITLSTIGFYLMVPGQSIVLYSRLHLVVQNQRTLRAVLYLIIVDAILMLIPTTVLTYSTVYVRTETIIEAYNVMERMQLAWFCAQEFVISGIYIVETVKLLRLWPDKDRSRNKIMYELVAINIVIILMDIALLVLEYLGFYTLQTTLKSAVYSVKLKLEFGVLGKLVQLIHTHCSEPNSTENEEFPNFVDPAQITSDVTHAAPVGTVHPRHAWGAISMESLDPENRPRRSVDTRPP